MDYSTRIDLVKSRISDYKELVQINDSPALRAAFEQAQKDLTKLYASTPEGLEVRLLKCEKSLAKLEMLWSGSGAGQVMEKDLERREKKYGIDPPPRKERLRWEKYAALLDDKSFEESMLLAGSEKERTRLAALRGLQVLDFQDPFLDQLRADLQEHFQGEATSRFTSELTPAKFDFIRMAKQNPAFSQPMEGNAVEEFFVWAKGNPLQAQYVLEDMAPFAIAAGRGNEFKSLAREIVEKGKGLPFAPPHPGGEDVKHLRALVTSPPEVSFSELTEIRKICQPIREREFALAEKGNAASAKAVYDDIVWGALKNEPQAEEKKKSKWRFFSYDQLTELPWTKWFVSPFRAGSVTEKVARVALSAVCVAGVAASVGGGIALAIAGSAAYGIGAIAGPLLISVGMAASGSLFAFGNMLLDRWFGEAKPANWSTEKKKAEAQKALNKKLVASWKKSGYLYTYPEAKEYFHRQSEADERELQIRFEKKKGELKKASFDANYAPSPFELAKASREVVEEYATSIHLHNKTERQIRSFEMAVNAFTNKTVGPQIQESLLKREPVIPDIEAKTL